VGLAFESISRQCVGCAAPMMLSRFMLCPPRRRSGDSLCLLCHDHAQPSSPSGDAMRWYHNSWFHNASSFVPFRWTGKCWSYHEGLRYEFELQFEIPVTYPVTNPDLCLPELEVRSPLVMGGDVM
jgi:hypothetical protein